MLPVVQMNRSDAHLRFTLRSLLMLVFAVALACWPVSCLFHSSGVARIRFEQEAWKRADPIADHRTVRSQMIDDLLRRHNFIGMSRQQVTDLLGEPDGWWQSTAPTELVYLLGMERGGAFSLDNEYLVFRLDAHGRVTKYHTTVD